MIKAIKKHFKKKDLRNRMEFAETRMRECREVGDEKGLNMWCGFWLNYSAKKFDLEFK